MSHSHSWDALRWNNSLPWSVIKNVDGFEIYFRLLLQEAIGDGIQHIELKTNLGNLHVKYGQNDPYDGKWLSQQDEIDAMMRVYNDPQNNFKDRISFRLILGAHRSLSPEILDKRFALYSKVRERNLHVAGGVDIFGPEETGHKNDAFLRTLKKLKDINSVDKGMRQTKSKQTKSKQTKSKQTKSKEDKDNDKDSPYVLSIHSGETDVVEYPVDSNLFSLLQLDANIPVRVGHGISLWKYPQMMKLFVNSGKHVEVSPLSNIILGYIDRVSNHPGLLYHKSKIPISINSDDPSYFGYNYVSFDWFMVILGWKLQLQDVVNICINSIEASALGSHDKMKLRQNYVREMKKFIGGMGVG